MKQLRLPWGITAILVLVLRALVLVSCGFYLVQKPSQIYVNYQIETTLSWDGPSVELSPANLQKLNADVAAELKRESPWHNYTYPVRSLGKRGLEVMYLSFEQPGPPPEMQETLNDFIQKRAGELAIEQVRTDPTG